MGVAGAVNVRGGTEEWQARGRPLDASDTGVEGPRIVETEWAHPGAS
jgi:hypothetical protein